MATSFRLHTFHLDGEPFVGNYFPDHDAISVFRERDRQFIATYAFSDATKTRCSRDGYWASIHSGINLSLLAQLVPAITALPLEQ